MRSWRLLLLSQPPEPCYPEIGATMNLFCRSLVLAASLFAVGGAITFAVARSRSPAPPVSPQSAVEGALISLDGRLTEVLERLDRLEAALAALPQGLRNSPQETAALSAPGSEQVASTARERKHPAPDLETEEAGDLRSFIHQVLKEEREERRQEEERRRIEEKRDWEELGQGPYGDFNLRVKCLTRVLGLDDRQKQRYFEILSHYSARLAEAARGLNKLDPESLRAHEERKKEVLGEFESVVLQTLTPSQAQQYRELPSPARSPGPESTKALTLLVIHPR
jgi:hypothetical protein